MRLPDKVAIITGGAQGIGRGIAQRFAEEGARVVLADIQAERGQATAQELLDQGREVSFVHTDVTVPAQLERMVAHAVERYGRLDVLVNNAYWNRSGTVLELSLEDWNRAWAAMVTATFLAVKYAVPHFERAGGGAVVSISSVHGLLAAGISASYETAKGALLLLTKELAVELGPRHIRVNAICPGWIATRPLDPAWEADVSRAGLSRQQYPLRRWGAPRDIANAALYLASEEASFVTGHALVVDGGLSIQLQDSVADRIASFVREQLSAAP